MSYEVQFGVVGNIIVFGRQCELGGAVDEYRADDQCKEIEKRPVRDQAQFPADPPQLQDVDENTGAPQRRGPVEGHASVGPDQ